MLWPRLKLDEAYARLKQQSLGGACTVLILVAADCDALCACRILTYLLRSDHIMYKVKPVSGYDDIARTNGSLI